MSGVALGNCENVRETQREKQRGEDEKREIPKIESGAKTAAKRVSRLA